MDFAILQQLGVAVALGTLIGLEREHRYPKGSHKGFGGIRTFGLIGLFGFLAYRLSSVSMIFLATVTFGFLALVVSAYVMSTRNSRDLGATSEVAAILVYLTGVLSAMDQYLIATVVALSVLVILHFKDTLHRLAKRIKNKELVSTIQFIIITFVILPLLPDQGYGPYEFFNPYIVWLMVVFVSGISFVSYIAMRIFGARLGIVLTGFLAGFISTTALTFSFASQSRKNKSMVNPYILGLTIAVSALFFRVLLEVFVVNRELYFMVAIPFVTMGVLMIAVSMYLVFRNREESKELDKKALYMESPFRIAPALSFAVIFAVVLFVTKFAANVFGNQAVYMASFAGGFFDMDSITISMARIGGNEVSLFVSTVAITFAVFANNLGKALIFLLFGNKKVALRLFLLFVPVMGIGGLTLFFI